jgi:hypothetical protein
MLPCGEEKLENEQLFVNSFCGERCVYTRDFFRVKNAIKRNTDDYVLYLPWLLGTPTSIRVLSIRKCFIDQGLLA